MKCNECGNYDEVNDVIECLCCKYNPNYTSDNFTPKEPVKPEPSHDEILFKGLTQPKPFPELPRATLSDDSMTVKIYVDEWDIFRDWCKDVQDRIKKLEG